MASWGTAPNFVKWDIINNVIVLYKEKGIHMKTNMKRLRLVSLLVCIVAMLIFYLQNGKEHNKVEVVEPVVETVQKTEVVEEPKPEFYLSDYERWVVECVVMGECEGEPYKGQVLVAQCLLNACVKDGLQPSEARKKYKYSGWKENPSESVKKAVSAVFDDGYKITDKFILYFYAPRWSKGEWHETQNFVTEVGGHRFFSEK